MVRYISLFVCSLPILLGVLQFLEKDYEMEVWDKHIVRFFITLFILIFFSNSWHPHLFMLYLLLFIVFWLIASCLLEYYLKKLAKNCDMS